MWVLGPRTWYWLTQAGIPVPIIAVSDIEAADVVAEQGYSRVFLTTGRSGIAAFANSDAWWIRIARWHRPANWCYLAAMVTNTSSHCREQRIDALVTKNSGGKMTRAKLGCRCCAGYFWWS